jgi:hypothetical protein
VINTEGDAIFAGAPISPSKQVIAPPPPPPPEYFRPDEFEIGAFGHLGGGLEYRFTPHIGIFGEIGYVCPNLSNNNFIQTNFGLRYAF